MTGLRMFLSMLLIDGAVLFVLYGLIRVAGHSSNGVESFLPACSMLAAGVAVRPRARTATRGAGPQREPVEDEPIVGRYR